MLYRADIEIQTDRSDREVRMIIEADTRDEASRIANERAALERVTEPDARVNIMTVYGLHTQSVVLSDRKFYRPVA